MPQKRGIDMPEDKKELSDDQKLNVMELAVRSVEAGVNESVSEAYKLIITLLKETYMSIRQ